jgi:Rhodopirellula transposase DDE domain
VLTNVHDFPHLGLGKAIPYGVYDLGNNNAWVSVGMNHDTPKFAVNSIRSWWATMGRDAYWDAKELLVTADGGGSNSARSRVWKVELQKFATETGLAITVVHFPPGTSKWNKVEHRLFSHITMNWRGRPLEDYETVVRLIGSTKTSTGLHVKARLDRRTYALGEEVPDSVVDKLNIKRSDFHGEWNYRLCPQPIA